MLQVNNIRKSYTTGDFTQVALDDVSLTLRDNEFVAILGPSGSGKTTLLNIIGGLDHYDSGDLIIDGISTKQYKDRDWDTYRNNRIGFVFQSYNLIPHQTVLANVEMALTLSGVGKAERKERAIAALQRVGLGDHIHKRPNQMSGGQMQRVAIARALINDPEILLADEPTGALDTKTSVQIMDLLTEIAKDRLVVMVTHNPELAKQYANRIITLTDGHILGDTNPYVPASEDFRASTKKVRKASMSFLTALSLSFNNLMTKKGRTIMTAFAGSIGIIGIAAILALANGVNSYIASVEEDTLSEYPLQISSAGYNLSSMVGNESNSSSSSSSSASASASTSAPSRPEDSVRVNRTMTAMVNRVASNDLASLKVFLESDECDVDNYAKSVEYRYGVTPLIYNSDTSGNLHQANPNNVVEQIYGAQAAAYMSSSSMFGTDIFKELPANEGLYKSQYDILTGRWPEKADELVLVTSPYGSITDMMAYLMALRDPDELATVIKEFMNGDNEDISLDRGESYYTYDQLMGTTFKLVNPTDCYQYNSANSVWLDKRDDEDYMRNLIDNATTLNIVGIVKANPDANATMLGAGLYYTSDLAQATVSYAANSEIVKQQLADPEVDVFSGNRFDEPKKKSSMNSGSLFSFNPDALYSAFSFDPSAISLDPSKFKIDWSSIDLGLSDIDFSDMPQPGDFGLSGISVDPAALQLSIQNLFTNMYQGFFAAMAADPVTYPATAAGFQAFLASPQGQAILAAGMAEIQNTFTYTGTPEDLTAYFNALREYFSAKMTTVIDTVTKNLSDQVSALIAANMNEIMAQMGSGLKIDPNAFSRAFSFNLDETALTELMTSMSTRDTASYEKNLSTLGYANFDTPKGINIYPIDFNAKQSILDILDAYNQRMQDNDEKDKVISYTDIVGTLMNSVTTIVDSLTAVLIAFVAISLVVSSIMIGIITYISVLERKKEIGILRALGASKGNISQVFNAETIIVGFLAGLIGVGITAIACFPVSALVLDVYDVPNVMQLPVSAGIILILISVLLTFIGGLIPARSASHKDPVEALRSE